MRILPLALVALFFASPSAARDRRPQVRSYADPMVVSLVSQRTADGGLVRAMVLVSATRTSVVFESQTARGVIDRQFEIERLNIEGRDIPMRRVEAVSDLAFGRQGLQFSIATERRDLDCFVALDRDGLPLTREAQCDRRRDGGDRPAPVPPRPPRPPQPQWARNPEVIRACGDAFTGQANELACLDRVDGFVSDPITTIRECDRHTTGDDNGLACVGMFERFVGDPGRVVAACDNATTGDNNLLRCVTEAARLGYTPDDVEPIILACDAAMTGDDNALRCIAATNGLSGGAARVVELIRTCDRAMTGDDAALTCIGRR